MVTSAEIFYGCVWRIEKDDESQEQATSLLRSTLEADDNVELYDMLDDLESKHGAHVSFAQGVVTVYFGVPLSSISEAENEFDEMALLRVMDLDNGSLKKEVREHMTKVMDSIPFALRDSLSAPRFGVAWAAG